MEKSRILSRVGKSDLIRAVPIVELAGRNRLLIENHQGVLGYSLEEIRVKVQYGCVCITGCDLRLMQMSKERLVICGRVDTVQFLGGSV